jgi:uncharacterized membrane protein YfcA
MPADVWLFLIAMGASALGGMLGMAGGIFVVPLLVSVMHLDMHAAIGASLISVIACSCSGSAPLLEERLVNIRLAVILETATSTGALTGVFLSGVLPLPALYALFTLILLLSAVQMFQRRKESVVPAHTVRDDRPAWVRELGASYRDRATGSTVAYTVQRVPLGMGLMYVAGLVSALLGIGSGVLKIPAMDTALRLPIRISSATSSFMIGVTASASVGAYLLRGDIDAAVAGPVALGSVVGAWLGARLLIRLSGEWSRMIFFAVLMLLSVQMGLKALGVDVL